LCAAPPYNKGNGAAVKTGARHATGDFVLIVDGDGQHHADDARRLVAPLGEFDLVVGARSPATQATLTRRAGNALLNWLASYLTGRPIPDLTSGFRGIRRDVLREFLHLLPNGFSTPTTTTLACIKAGYNVTFEPIDAGVRAGQLEDARRPRGRRFLLILLKVVTIFSPLRIFAPISRVAFAVGAIYGDRELRDRRTHPERRGGAAAVCRDRVSRGLVSEQIAALRFRDPEIGIRMYRIQPLVQKPFASLVFFPCYNDGKTIGDLVVEAERQLQQLTDDYEVIVVNDGSSDESAEVLRGLAARMPRLTVITHERNRGYGGALRSGFGAATKDLVFYTDGDGQYDVRELPVLLMLLTDDTDFVNGIKMTRQDPAYRVHAGNVHRFVMRWSFWLPIHDVDCDFRLIRRRILDGIELRSNSGSICVELVKHAQRAGAGFREVSGPPLRAEVGEVAVLQPGRILPDVSAHRQIWSELDGGRPFRRKPSARIAA
jgi:glycosyltransferase involved in cell wall biosynthesis